MFARLVELSRSSLLLGFLVRPVMMIVLGGVDRWYRIMGTLRARGLLRDQWASFCLQKSDFAGQRCFIVATGPSLTIEDLEAIKDEHTFGMNSICRIYEKTDFRPTFYCIQDQYVYRALESDIRRYYIEADNVFVSDRVRRYARLPKQWNVFPLNVAYHSYDAHFRKSYRAKFSTDVLRQIYDGFSVTMTAIQIAAYLGFSEIYLIGADCSFAASRDNHIAEHGVVDRSLDTAQARNLAGYAAALAALTPTDTKIFNATRGGALEMFPRVRLEDVLATPLGAADGQL